MQQEVFIYLKVAWRTKYIKIHINQQVIYDTCHYSDTLARVARRNLCKNLKKSVIIK